MKTLKVLLYVLVIAGVVAVFALYSPSRSGNEAADRLAGVLLSPPPGYVIAEHGELRDLPPTFAAAELSDQVQRPPATGKVGIRFRRGGGTVYWLADVPGDFLEELASGPNGTRLQTVWRGGIRERLSWAREHGDFAAPGLPAAERKNLYH